MGEEACVATRVKGVQSDAMLNLRMLCLERRLDQAKTITALFARADTGVVESAVSMAHALPPLEECADLVALSARVRPPEDAVLRGKVEAVRTRLGAAQASLDAGRYGEAEGDARQALEAARELGWRPVTAEAALLDGAIAARRGEWSRSEASLHESILAAEASRHDEALVRGWTTLSMTFSRQGKFALARAAGEHAEAFLVGMPRAERLLAEVENNAGAVDFAQGRAKEAAEHHARALALREKAPGPSHPDVAQSLTNLGGAESSLGDEQNATQHSQRAVDLLETLYGPDHPRLAEPLTNLAIRSRRKGDLDGAERLYRRAIGLVERGVGKHAPNLALVYSNLSLLLDEKHDLDGAERAARRALEICEENGGDANPTTANALVSLGWLGHRRGEHREALALFERAARVREKALGPKAERLANPLIGMGREWVDLGEARRALAPLERALALRLEKAEHSEKDLAEVRFQLARALFDAGKDRARAVRLASEAHQAWAAAGKDSKDDADRSRAFLDAVKAGRPPPGPPREP
jgi:tetratricopeptide (TPR) repeat protein